MNRVPGTSAGSRLMTGRLMTGMTGGGVASGISLTSDISVSDRPVTQQGVMGVRKKTGGPGRQIMDATYYASILRSKCNEVSSEVEKLKQEVSIIVSNRSILW